MSIAVIRHVPFEDIGRIGEAVRAEALEVRYFDPGDAPDPLAYQALIVMGGPMSANDDLPWIAAEIGCIRRAIDAGRPVLGVCLGAQMIARALGARVYRNPRKEIGWYPIHWTDTGATDPLFRGLPNPLPVFHWHGETFDLPAGAEWLAYSEACRHQAFRWSSHVYALQFHVEVTPEMIEDWIAQPANCGDIGDLSAPPDPQAHAEAQKRAAETIFGRWAARVKRGAWSDPARAY